MTNINTVGKELRPPPPQFDRMKRKLPKYKKWLLAIVIPWATLLLSYRALNNPINFYGMVLDMDDKPIPGVWVRAAIKGDNQMVVIIPYYSSFNRDVYRKTDKKGRFKIRGYYGNGISYIGESPFRKDRYEYVMDETPTHISYTPDSKFKPDSNNPLIYRMRKLEETTFLLQGPGRNASFGAGTNEEFACYDLIRSFRLWPEDIKADTWTTKYGKLYICDLRIISKWNESKNRWEITYEPGTKNGGIQIQNKKLYTAPEDGYKSEVTFYVYKDRLYFVYLKESPDEPFEPCRNYNYNVNIKYHNHYYLYLKSRDCEIYSRIELTVPELHTGKIYLDAKVTTNPYAGQRSLEMEPNIPYELRKVLEDEIRTAFNKDPNAVIPPPPKEMNKLRQWDVARVIAERSRK
jgi:hypothetical protein